MIEYRRHVANRRRRHGGWFLTVLIWPGEVADGGPEVLMSPLSGRHPSMTALAFEFRGRHLPWHWTRRCEHRKRKQKRKWYGFRGPSAPAWYGYSHGFTQSNWSRRVSERCETVERPNEKGNEGERWSWCEPREIHTMRGDKNVVQNRVAQRAPTEAVDDSLPGEEWI